MGYRLTADFDEMESLCTAIRTIGARGFAAVPEHGESGALRVRWDFASDAGSYARYVHALEQTRAAGGTLCFPGTGHL
jgi:hypothetical protein